MVSTRAKRILRRVGWAYIAYHAVIATLLVASAIHDLVPSYWRRTEFQLKMLFVIFAYPALTPSFAVCGGLHNGCTTMFGHAMQVVAISAGVFSYLMGCWVLTSFVVKRFRRSSSGTREQA